MAVADAIPHKALQIHRSQANDKKQRRHGISNGLEIFQAMNEKSSRSTRKAKADRSVSFSVFVMLEATKTVLLPNNKDELNNFSKPEVKEED